jgi:hypothetical protein
VGIAISSPLGSYFTHQVVGVILLHEDHGAVDPELGPLEE